MHLRLNEAPASWATGIRHEMANIVTVIHLACEMLPEVDSDGQLALVQSMIIACERGKSLLTSRASIPEISIPDQPQERKKGTWPKESGCEIAVAGNQRT